MRPIRCLDRSLAQRSMPPTWFHKLLSQAPAHCPSSVAPAPFCLLSRSADQSEKILSASRTRGLNSYWPGAELWCGSKGSQSVVTGIYSAPIGAHTFTPALGPPTRDHCHVDAGITSQTTHHMELHTEHDPGIFSCTFHVRTCAGRQMAPPLVQTTLLQH